MGRPSPARARLTRSAVVVVVVGRLGAAVAVVVLVASIAWAEGIAAPIVGGAPTTGHAAVGALLVGTDPATAVTDCTATLVGCRTLVTAAHCVCTGTGAQCQGAQAPSPAGRVAFFAHAGFVAIEQIAVHPDYVFPVADVAVLRLATQVTAIAPLGVNAVATPLFGTSGTIVGFGWQSTVARDSGIKRVGTVTTAPCAGGISDATSVCWDYTGPGANSCQGDSGGPLLIDFGGGPVVAGVTSGGFSLTCLPTDHSYDANLFIYRDWIATAAAGDLGAAGCGGIPTVDAPGVIVRAFTGDLGDTRTLALHSIGVAPGTAELRVALEGVEGSGTDFDLYVRSHVPPAAGEFDCGATGTGQYGFCRIPDPAPGSWYLRAERVRGAGLFQLVTTTIGGEPSVCGNGIREPGEDCDGTDTGTCTTGCDPTCGCVQCSDTDLDVRQIELSPRLLLQASLGDAVGTYTAVDPQSAGLMIEIIDATHTVPIVIPPRDPAWVLVNPRRGKYRWRGQRGAPVRRIEFRTRPRLPTEWRIVVVGRNLPGTATIDYQTLIVRVRIGTRCGERRFHVERTPAIPRG